MALYGAVAWGMRSAERKKVNILQIIFFQKFGASVKNENDNFLLIVGIFLK